jgi:hypothetical protein
MPLMLADDDREILMQLAAPLELNKRDAFLTKKRTLGDACCPMDDARTRDRHVRQGLLNRRRQQAGGDPRRVRRSGAIENSLPSKGFLSAG